MREDHDDLISQIPVSLGKSKKKGKNKMKKINWDEPIEVVFFDGGNQDVYPARLLGSINNHRHYVFIYEHGETEYTSTALANGNSLDNTRFKVRNIKQEPREFELWINVYADGHISKPFMSKSDADIRHMCYGSKLLACKRIVIKEGDFDND